MQKTIFKSIINIMFVTVLFFSCSQKNISNEKNEYGFFEDLDAAKVVAKKSKKKIALIITMKDYDDFSQKFCEQILSAPEGKNLFQDYVIAHFDFGTKFFESMNIPDNASEKEKKRADEIYLRCQKSMKFAQKLSLQYTPAIFFLTEEGYCLGNVYCAERDLEIDGLEKDINLCVEDFKFLEALIAATKEGSVFERISAIEEIYDAVPESFINTYADLFRQAPKIDKKNETGLASSLYLEAILSDSLSFYSEGDYFNSARILLAATQENILEGPEKQQCFYMAGYLLASSGSDNIQEIIAYFQSAIDAYPEGEIVPQIQEVIENLKSMIMSDEEADANQNILESQ